MKLSKMKTDHLFEVLGVVGEELGEFFADSELTDKLEKLNIKDENETSSAFGLRSVKDVSYIMAAINKKYKTGIYNIIGAFKQLPPEQVGDLTIPEVWDQIRESLDDELFLGFFPSLRYWVGRNLFSILLKRDPATVNSSSDTSLENTEPTPQETELPPLETMSESN